MSKEFFQGIKIAIFSSKENFDSTILETSLKETNHN